MEEVLRLQTTEASGPELPCLIDSTSSLANFCTDWE
jgi:hypothetical protein